MSNSGDEQKIHDSTMATLKHRIQIVKIVLSYLSNSDINSAFRLLHNCNNNPILHDGLLAVHNFLKADKQIDILNLYQLIQLAQKLLESKYQSHIETSLEVLLANCRSLWSIETQNKKVWQEIVKMLRSIIESKRFKKLEEQEKNKHIFELAYELKHSFNHQLPTKLYN